MKELIINKPVEFSSADWLNVSDGLKDLLQKMLDKDPLHRILIFKILCKYFQFFEKILQ